MCGSIGVICKLLQMALGGYVCVWECEPVYTVCGSEDIIGTGDDVNVSDTSMLCAPEDPPTLTMSTPTQGPLTICAFLINYVSYKDSCYPC